MSSCCVMCCNAAMDVCSEDMWTGLQTYLDGGKACIIRSVRGMVLMSAFYKAGLWTHYLPECQIDPCAKTLRPLGHSMHPMILRCTLHCERVPIAQWERELAAVITVVAQHKVASLAKRDRAYHRLRPIQHLIVRVPAHVVSAIAVQIQKA